MRTHDTLGTSAPQHPAGRAGPQRADYEEFLRTPVGALRAYVDRDARPLCGEAIVDDPAFRATIDHRRCHYAGSRHGHALPMNASALKQMTKNWDEILAVANTLRILFAGGPVPVAEGLASAMRVAYGGVCLPLFLLYRAAAPWGDAQVPGFVSGLHKASIDIATSTQLMLVEGFNAAGPESPPSDGVVQDIVDFVEREGILVGQKGVCAGPPQLIRELLEAMVHGRGRRLTGASDAVEELGDLTRAAPYVDELIKIWIAKHLVIAHNGRLMDTLEARANALGAGGLSAADVDAGIREHRARESHPVLVSNVIARQEQASRSLDAGQYGRLLCAVEAAAASLAWVDREPANRLLEHARAGSASEERAQAFPKVRRIADDRLDSGIADLAVAALLDAVKMEQLALRYFASTEANIRNALGLSGISRPLSTDDLTAVFGMTPSDYLGVLLGIESSVDAGYIVLRGPRGVFVL
jgi:hypothetical protein